MAQESGLSPSLPDNLNHCADALGTWQKAGDQRATRFAAPSRVTLAAEMASGTLLARGFGANCRDFATNCRGFVTGQRHTTSDRPKAHDESLMTLISIELIRS